MRSSSITFVRSEANVSPRHHRFFPRYASRFKIGPRILAYRSKGPESTTPAEEGLFAVDVQVLQPVLVFRDFEGVVPVLGVNVVLPQVWRGSIM